MTPPTSFFLYNTALYILNHVSFHKNFAVVFSSSTENVIGILMETTLSLRTDKGIVAFQSLSRSCLSVLCDSMISMFLEAPVWWWCEFYHLCLSEDIFFFSSISKVNIAGYNILGWPIVISFWTLNRPYHSLLAYKDFAKKVCCLLVCWGRVGELLNMIWWFSLCLEFCLGIFIVRD